jgi:hypothetical protein
MMRSHMTAFGVGAGLSLLAAGVFALVAPRIAEANEEGDGVHIINIGGGDNGSFYLKDKGINVTAEWKGDFSFAGDGRSLTALKKKLEVTSKDKGVERKAVFENKDGAISATVIVDDRDMQAGPEADKAAADLLQLFARSSGVDAEGRVKAMLASGGKDAVIAEIGQLVGSHAVGAYIQALAGAAPLTSDDVRTLAARIKGLESDYAKRSAITGLLGADDLNDAAIAAILDVAKTIEGDHELRLIIDDLAEKDMSARNFGVAVSLIGEIEGDHEVRLAISSLLENDHLSDADAARALDVAAKRIEGDYELRLAIESADTRLNKAEVGAAAVAAIGSIESAHDRRLAIESVASEFDDASTHWLALIAATTGIDSDHERRLALEALASDAPDAEDIKTTLRKAAQSIESDHERSLAMEAIG